jgi:gliding motility-associated-like protein
MNLNLEDKLKSRLDNAQVIPPDDVFQRIQNTLSKGNPSPVSQKKDYGFRYYLAGAVIISASIISAVYFFQDSPEPSFNNQAPPSERILVQPDPVQSKSDFQQNNQNNLPPSSSSSPNLVSLNPVAGQDQEVCGKKTKLEARFSSNLSVGKWIAESKSVSFVSESMQNAEEDPNATIVVNEYGVYKLKWMESVKSQNAFDEVSIRFKETPAVNLKDKEEVCGLEIQIHSGGKIGSWSSPDNVIITTPQSAQSTIRSIKAGSYDLVWTENLDGCKSSDTITLSFSNQPMAKINLIQQDKCSPEVTISAPDPSNNKYTWNFGDGISQPLPNNTYLVRWSEPGKHSIALKVENSAGCLSEAKLELIIPELPSALFQADQLDQSAPALVYFNRKFSSSVNTDKMYEYRWDFGDGRTSDLPDPEHIYKQPGRYTVKLTVSDENGCSSSYAGQNIVVKSESTYPGTVYFTPNGDNLNDYFEVFETQLDQFTCVILNQKGEKITELNQNQPRWDGRLKTGNPASEGLYYFIIRGISPNGQKTERNGLIYLLKE